MTRHIRLSTVPVLIAVQIAALVACAMPGSADDAGTAPAAPAGGKLITIELAKSEIRDALRLIAQGGGINLVIGPEIEGNVSVHLDNVPVEIALKSIAVNNNLRYVVQDGVVTISKHAANDPSYVPPPPPLVTRAFRLRSQDAQRIKEAIEHILTKNGKMTVLNENSDASYVTGTLNSLAGEVTGGSSGSGSGSPGLNGGAQSSSQNGGGGSSGGAQGGTQGSGNQMNAPRNSRTLIVTDIAEKVRLVAALVADLDRLPPQVLIEARIVEMSTNLQRQLGIDWNPEALVNGPILNHELPLHNRAGFASGDQIRRDFMGAPYQTNGLALGSIDLSRFTALLKANQDDNAVRLLANPRMLVFNNHSASILVGERYPIFQANVSNFGTVTEAFQTYIPVGTQLEVTPTIMSDGRISLLVHPATSALGDDVVGTTGLRVARIQTREISTRAIMRDGETIVLGGLISDRKTHSARKVPGLGDWAGLSILFRQERPSSERVDLLVFLTAHVEGSDQISERDQKVFDMYRPHFKQIERLQDVPLHFEIPTEYEAPKPRFTDPPAEPVEDELRDVPAPGEHPAPPPPPPPAMHEPVMKDTPPRTPVGPDELEPLPTHAVSTEAGALPPPQTESRPPSESPPHTRAISTEGDATKMPQSNLRTAGESPIPSRPVSTDGSGYLTAPTEMPRANGLPQPEATDPAPIPRPKMFDIPNPFGSATETPGPQSMRPTRLSREQLMSLLSNVHSAPIPNDIDTSSGVVANPIQPRTLWTLDTMKSPDSAPIVADKILEGDPSLMRARKSPGPRPTAMLRPTSDD